jgi:hypothetical protein
MGDAIYSAVSRDGYYLSLVMGIDLPRTSVIGKYKSRQALYGHRITY